MKCLDQLQSEQKKRKRLFKNYHVNCYLNIKNTILTRCKVPCFNSYLRHTNLITYTHMKLKIHRHLCGRVGGGGGGMSSLRSETLFQCAGLRVMGSCSNL